jgi:hypothetical protein
MPVILELLIQPFQEFILEFHKGYINGTQSYVLEATYVRDCHVEKRMAGVVGSTKILKKIKSDLFLDLDRTQCSSSIFNKFSVHDIMYTSGPIATYLPTHKVSRLSTLVKFRICHEHKTTVTTKSFCLRNKGPRKPDVLCNVRLMSLWDCQKQNITYFCQALTVKISDSANILVCLLLYEYYTMSRLVHYVMFCTMLLCDKPYFTMKINNN